MRDYIITLIAHEGDVIVQVGVMTGDGDVAMVGHELPDTVYPGDTITLISQTHHACGVGVARTHEGTIHVSE